MRDKDNKVKQGHSLAEFIKILRLGKSLGGLNYDLDLNSFFEFYIDQLKNKLSTSGKACKYYFTINPKDIIVLDMDK